MGLEDFILELDMKGEQSGLLGFTSPFSENRHTCDVINECIKYEFDVTFPNVEKKLYVKLVSSLELLDKVRKRNCNLIFADRQKSEKTYLFRNPISHYSEIVYGYYVFHNIDILLKRIEQERNTAKLIVDQKEQEAKIINHLWSQYKTTDTP